MPLVVPGLTSNSGDDKTSGWMNQLMGKKLGDSSNETVCSSPFLIFLRAYLLQVLSSLVILANTHSHPDLRQNRPPQGAPRDQGG